MASWNLLDERSESELHKTRLLNVEEKPLKRITKRLAAISSAVSRARGALDKSSSDQDDGPGGSGEGRISGDDGGNGDGRGENSLLTDLTHDFAAFDSSIARFQFLFDASMRERERYGADQQRILSECEAVRNNNSRLREQLDAARATLAQRNKFDELAERITSNRLLRPRDDQRVNLAKLEEECRELERESETYSCTWKERRDQFNRIMEEGMMLRRLIRDEKEEVDRREGMNEDADDDADAPTGQTPRMATATGDESTPQAADGNNSQSMKIAAAARRLEASDADTPARSDQAPDDGSRDDVDMEDGEERPTATAGTDDGRGGGNRGIESTEEENMVVDE
ncbi:hypothetical protein CP533_6104 [Ophiocordyceps camponoti-saundersi (nom. inval.)]|nr:hypothetical protein CP533_6104 [Ophiocordyceps camponoti-saundersi (nom. inval.)]